MRYALLLGACLRASLPCSLAWLSACHSAFECEADSWCTRAGEQGRCDQGYCSFMADSCPSGYAWGPFAAAGLVGRCVPPIEGGSSSSASSGDASGDTAGRVPADACPAQPPCTLYVAMDGLDDAAGTIDAPVATVQRAIDLFVPGESDAICVAPGQYTESVLFAKSGTAEKPIVLRATGNGAQLIGDVEIKFQWGQPVGYIVVEGFDISGSNAQCIYVHGAHDVVLRRNVIHGCANGAIRGRIRDSVLDGNRFEGHGDAGVVITGTNIKVHNNVFANNAAAGLVLAGVPWVPPDPQKPDPDPHRLPDERWSGASGFEVSNNVFLRNKTEAVRVADVAAEDDTIQNNIFFENSEPAEGVSGPNGIFFSQSGDGHIVRSNLYAGTALPIVTAGEADRYVETDPLLTDPRFVDADALHFHLRDDSPAIDYGILDLAPDHDISCRPRPLGEGVDLGVYEVR